MVLLDPPRLRRAYETARAALLAERTAEGHWVGELSTSALSTAVAVGALSLVDRHAHARMIGGGLDWLAAHQNADGGWGDTVKSFSNISTTMLCRSAFHLAKGAERYPECLQRSEAWLAERYGKTSAEVAEAVRRRYGKDRTFSVPILMTSALAGLVSWAEVPRLPFELACFPQSWYRLLRMPVVSYALPALIAIGQAVHHHRGSWSPLRRLAIRPSLRVLERIQPSNGGFLEATPLTGFVALALASTGKKDHPVVRKCVAFILASVRADGSWPIDTNLATWVTTLSVNALAAAGEIECLDKREELLRWLLDQQSRERHLYTGAEPGAWGWTPLPGSVPDADDTPGAILALRHLAPLVGADCAGEVRRGAEWLANLQNRDGGIPTFCRGWGALPFDRSGPDLTAHTLRAWHAIGWNGAATDRALAYLARQQRPDGSWLPLWFGNQHTPDDINPTYGTAKVLAAYRDLGLLASEPARRGVAWLVANQNDDGGWGGGKGTPSSIEETALAVEALADGPVRARSVSEGGASPVAHAPGSDPDAVARGLAWLIDAVEQGRLHDATPIGFYFAKLWYFERLYPLAFAVAALWRAANQ
jgi:squalene-hopene/tetraprenyl-beta-curcumene cyclase